RLFHSQKEIATAALAQSREVNPQAQPNVVGPASRPVARAYRDQLTRTKSSSAQRARKITAALDRAGKIGSSRNRNAAAVVRDLNSLTNALDGDAAKAAGQDAARMKSLATTMRGITAKLH